MFVCVREKERVRERERRRDRQTEVERARDRGRESSAAGTEESAGPSKMGELPLASAIFSALHIALPNCRLKHRTEFISHDIFID